MLCFFHFWGKGPSKPTRFWGRQMSLWVRNVGWEWECACRLRGPVSDEFFKDFVDSFRNALFSSLLGKGGLKADKTIFIFSQCFSLKFTCFDPSFHHAFHATFRQCVSHPTFSTVSGGRPRRQGPLLSPPLGKNHQKLQEVFILQTCRGAFLLVSSMRFSKSMQ